MGDVNPVPRTRPLQGPERAMLESMLDCYRATVINTVAAFSRFLPFDGRPRL